MISKLKFFFALSIKFVTELHSTDRIHFSKKFLSYIRNNICSYLVV